MNKPIFNPNIILYHATDKIRTKLQPGGPVARRRDKGEGRQLGLGLGACVYGAMDHHLRPGKREACTACARECNSCTVPRLLRLMPGLVPCGWLTQVRHLQGARPIGQDLPYNVDRGETAAREPPHLSSHVNHFPAPPLRSRLSTQPPHRTLTGCCVEHRSMAASRGRGRGVRSHQDGRRLPSFSANHLTLARAPLLGVHALRADLGLRTLKASTGYCKLSGLGSYPGCTVTDSYFPLTLLH